MTLERKREADVIPPYSLTGDLLSFLRCGLQYRYHNGSALPPSRPVQMWFGEFIHGVMEAAYRIWRTSTPQFPWPCNPTPIPPVIPAPARMRHDIGEIGDVVEGTLKAQGKTSRSKQARMSAYRRAAKAVNEIGPHLFPLVHAAEERIIGTRQLTPPKGTLIRSSRYELHGIVDVVSNVELSQASSGNLLRNAIVAACPGLTGNFEVIVDYKGARRPSVNHDFWKHGEWQLQTYAFLRTCKPGSLPTAAGVLIYINELAPSTEDLVDLKQELKAGTTDVIPDAGSDDSRLLQQWKKKDRVPEFSFGFRLKRALRVIPINPATQNNAAATFDKVVLDIETCIAKEAVAGKIKSNWPSCGDESTCVACDFRHFCPSPAPRSARRKSAIMAPAAP